MSELSVVDYHDAARAGEVLAALKQAHPEWGSDLADAAVFVKHADETVRVARQPSDAPSVSKPLSVEAWQEQMGLTDAFMFQVQRLIRPGDSVLLMLIRAGDPDQVIDDMQQYGGRVLHTPFTSQQAEQFQSGLASEPEAWA